MKLSQNDLIQMGIINKIDQKDEVDDYRERKRLTIFHLEVAPDEHEKLG